MENLKISIQASIKNLYNITDVPVEFTPTPDDVAGDYATNIALRLAKPLSKSPRTIAEEIIQATQENWPTATGTLPHSSTSSIKSQGKTLQPSPHPEQPQEKLQGQPQFTIAGAGFINIALEGHHLMSELRQNWSETYGESAVGRGKRAIVEFPSPNMAKPYSVGHLRPGNQGWAVKQLLEATGWEVITDNHLGDSGTPFGIWATGFTRSGKSLDTITVYELGEIYIEMKKALKEEEQGGQRVTAGKESSFLDLSKNEEGQLSAGPIAPLHTQVQDWLLRLENKDPEAVKLSERFNEISLKHIHEVMTRLGLKTDYELGESFFLEQGKQLVQQHLKQGIFTKNPDGSIICPLEDQGIDVPILVRKSNGAALYATTDLATMTYRATEFHPDLVVHAVGVEQKFYFEQLFAMGRKLNLPQQNSHLWFGTIDQLVDGKREKMSSRKGVILMEELLDKAEATARDITKDREISEEDIKKIATGAIKFTDFLADRKTNILFDWSKIFALTGFSGPFCQYAAVRMNKIIAQNLNTEATDYSTYTYEPEKPLIKLLLEYPAIVKLAAEKLEAHRIATYTFRLAQSFNRYYESTPVSQASPIERSARLDLLRKLSQVFAHSLNLLGIEIPTRM